MGKKNNVRNSQLEEAVLQTVIDKNMYLNKMIELSMSMFKWVNLPKTIDERFIELSLFSQGACVFFKDEVLGFLCLRCILGGNFDVYDIPIHRRAIATNGYQRNLTNQNSVIIYNNMLHTNSYTQCIKFADMLTEIDSTIRVNIKAQKTPVLISCSENERLTYQNLYFEFDGNMPVIFGNKGLKENPITSINTQAPFISPALYDLKANIWNEALTYLGISNIAINKKERLITDEVMRSQGGTLANRNSRLNERKKACELINDMFNLNIDCVFREGE